MRAAGPAVELYLYGGDPDSAASLVSLAETDGCQAILVGRLYYRDDVVARWGSPPAAAGDSNDAALALWVYRCAGTEGLERLEGEFALIVVDREQHRIVAMRDPLGGYPVYWSRRGGTLALGTSLRALVALLPDAPLDFATLAEFLALSGGEPDGHEGTVFSAVQRVVAGGMVVFDLAQQVDRARRYWNWPDHVVDPATDDLDALGERYAEVLRAAVHERLRGGVAAHLSGGMDSTSIALVAHEQLANRGRQLHALSLVYERLDRLAEERRYVEAATGRPGLVAHRIAADDMLDFDSVDDGALYDEPFAGSFRVNPDIAMIDRAAAAGCGTILTGMGADEVLDSAPFHIADLVRTGRVGQAWSEATHWAQVLERNPWAFLWRFGVAPLVPAAVNDGIGSWLRRGRVSWGSQRPTTIPPWILPEFARRERLRERMLVRRRSSFPSAASIVLSDALGRVSQACGDWTRHSLAAPRNVHLAHPFRDPRVLSLGLGARVRIRPTPTQQKPLLARAMKDVLPPLILRRRDKAHFNALYYEGLARNRMALQDMVRASNVDDLGLFDKKVLIDCLADASLGYRDVAATVGLDSALVMTKWLSQLPRWREVPMVATRVHRWELQVPR